MRMLNLPTQARILAIAPSSRGFGFALIEGVGILVDWGVRNVGKDKNVECLTKVRKMLAEFRPDALILENFSGPTCRRSTRVKRLSALMARAATKSGFKVGSYSREEITHPLLGGEGTKYDLAVFVAEQFPEELGFRLPPKRRPWMSEDYGMAIFEAVALALMPRRIARQNIEAKKAS